LGRTLTQTAADASPTSYVYLGNTVKVTDPAGNWKRYTSDTLGNLVKVEEPNPAYGQADNTGTNFVTNYAYDVEGHLVSVSMPRPGASQPQTRTFNYNLATNTLTSSTNPENGTVSYTYYGDGLLKSKTDAKGQQVQYSYDGYGRLAYIDRYSDAVTWLPCRSVALTYDSSSTGTNLLGRVSTAVTGYSSSCTGQTLAEYYGYTPGGQVTLKKYGINYPTYWATPSVEYIGYQEGPTATFSYDTEGHQTGYNSFTYTLDAMGRPTGLTETGPGTVWAQNAAYGPSGEMQTMQYRSSAGSYFTENRTYNSRVQLIELASNLAGKPLTDLKYNYTAGVNNGQVASMTDLLSQGADRLYLRFSEEAGQGRGVGEFVGAVVRIRWLGQSVLKDADGWAYGDDDVIECRSDDEPCNGDRVCVRCEREYDERSRNAAEYRIDLRRGEQDGRNLVRPAESASGPRRGVERIWAARRAAGDVLVYGGIYVADFSGRSVRRYGYNRDAYGDGDAVVAEYLFRWPADSVERDHGGDGPAGIGEGG
jgi:YD repeat-containing protein